MQNSKVSLYSNEDITSTLRKSEKLNNKDNLDTIR